MSVKVDKNSMTKGVVKPRKVHTTIDVVPSTPTHSLALRNRNKTILVDGTNLVTSGSNTGTSKCNAMGKKIINGNGSGVVNGAHRRKTPSSTRRRGRKCLAAKPQGDSAGIIDHNDDVESTSNSGEWLKQFCSKPNEQTVLPNSARSEYNLRYTSGHPTRVSNAGATSRGNHTIEDVPQLTRHPLSSPHLTGNCDSLSEHEANTYDVHSECSSLNSSITQTSRTQDRLGRGTENMTQQGQYQDKEEGYTQGQEHCNDSILIPDGVEDTEQLTPYDEDDEEEAVQRYMENSASMSALRSKRKLSARWHAAALEVMVQTTSDAEATSIGRLRTPRSARFGARKFWRETSRPSSPLPREKQLHKLSSERILPDGLSDAICRSLSFYNAFFFDRDTNIWSVDDRVLARCLAYVGLMGYEMPTPTPGQFQERQPQQLETISAEMWGQLSSPVVPVSQNRKGGAESVGHSLCQWMLNGKPSWTRGRSKVSVLFLSQQEAERWLSEQEFVIGTVLACCACDDRGPPCGSDGVMPYLAPMWHPIVQAAAYVLERFPHWGGVSGFTEMWERQVGVVLGTAAPSHQRLFTFHEENIVFSSDMESGNLARVERVRNAPHQPTFNLWLEPEPGCEQRLWFRFAFAGARPLSAICLRLVNLQPNAKLYLRNGMRPVWRAGNSPRQWTPVGQCVYRSINNDTDGELTFVIIPRSTDVIQVAFCVPYTYADLLCHICHWHQLVKMSVSGIRFEERVLCYTQDGRKLHLLAITSPTAKGLQTRDKLRGNKSRVNGIGATATAVLTGVNPTTTRRTLLGPYSHFDNGKKVVLLSARVHPGEVTASHGIHGAISFLLSHDPQAALLREHFVFYIVPMLNPDAVARGHSRLDQNGFNLNRCYNNPIPQTQPTVNALRKVFEHLQQTFRERFFMYMDFHSHASQSSGFMFGNYLPLTVQHWNMVFPKIVSLHAKDVFSFSLCRFGKGHMTSKEGSSRVIFGGSLIHSYTVELTHFSNNRMYVDGVSSEDTATANRPLLTGQNGEGESWESRYAITHEMRRRPITNTRIDARVSSPTSSSSTLVPSSRSRSVNLRQQSKQQQQQQERQQSSKRQGSTKRNAGGHTAHDGVAARRRLPLRHIEIPCVLTQSAEVGRACLVALLDYCGIENQNTPCFMAYGGIERTLREVKRNGNATCTAKPPAYRLQSNYKQY